MSCKSVATRPVKLHSCINYTEPQRNSLKLFFIINNLVNNIAVPGLSCTKTFHVFQFASYDGAQTVTPAVKASERKTELKQWSWLTGSHPAHCLHCENCWIVPLVVTITEDCYIYVIHYPTVCISLHKDVMFHVITTCHTSSDKRTSVFHLVVLVFSLCWLQTPVTLWHSYPESFSCWTSKKTCGYYGNWPCHSLPQLFLDTRPVSYNWAPSLSIRHG